MGVMLISSLHLKLNGAALGTAGIVLHQHNLVAPTVTVSGMPTNPAVKPRRRNRTHSTPATPGLLEWRLQRTTLQRRPEREPLELKETGGTIGDNEPWKGHAAPRLNVPAKRIGLAQMRIRRSSAAYRGAGA